MQLDISMDSETMNLVAFIAYIGSFCAISLAGIYTGWYAALWIWIVPLLTGWEGPDE
jgi:hypothetical protein